MGDKTGLALALNLLVFKPIWSTFTSNYFLSSEIPPDLSISGLFIEAIPNQYLNLYITASHMTENLKLVFVGL